MRKKGGLKIRKVTNEERKLNKMYTEGRESARIKKKGSVYERMNREET